MVRISYRGYGLSEGKPSESGLQLDAQAALDYLHHDRTDIDRWWQSTPGRACEHLAFLSVPAQSGNASRCSRTRCIIIPVLRAEAALLFLDGR